MSLHSSLQIASFLDPLFYRHLTESDRKAAKKTIAAEMEKLHRPIALTRTTASSRTSSITATSIGVQSTSDVFDEFDRLCGLKPTEKLPVGVKQLSIDEEIISTSKLHKQQMIFGTSGKSINRLYHASPRWFVASTYAPLLQWQVKARSVSPVTCSANRDHLCRHRQCVTRSC